MNSLNTATGIPTALFFVFFLWSVLWKGLALWRSANLKQKNWFVVMLVLNGATLGVLEIVYLFFFATKKMTLKELKFWEKK